MISKYILPVFALAAVFLVVAVPYTSAAGENIVQHNIELDVKSANQDRYDKVVNIADPSRAITNPDTWTPSPQGIWLGASTEESLFQFSEIMPSTNRFILASSVKFNSTQIMNGASITVVRSPVSSDGVSAMTLVIHRLLSPGWNMTDNGQMSADALEVARIDIDMTDTSITSGNDCWTVDGRTYVEVHAPIYSDVTYVFQWIVRYQMDVRPAIYLSSQDVANDGEVRTELYITHTAAPDEVYRQRYSWNIEPGISYDMRNGLGNGLYAESKYVRTGDQLRFNIVQPFNSHTFFYDTLMLPFATDDSRLKARVELMQGKDKDASQIIWTEDREEWIDYILACSDETSTGHVGGNLWIRITFLENKRVNFMFIDSPKKIDVYDRNRAEFVLDGINHVVYARPWHSYQHSVFPVTSPSMDPADAPIMPEVVENQRMNWYGSLIGVALIVAGAALIPIGLGVPVMIAGAAMIGTGVSLLILDEIAHNKGYSGVGEYLGGTFSNAIDNLWESLEGVGNFLYAVGEGIWDGLVWFADAVTEYGSVLLGLLIIGVSLALFFAPIYTQLKLWGIAWRMAEGDVQAAAAQAQDLASQASGVMSKLRRH